MENINGKVAFITGGSKGIGLGVAKTLTAQGMKVAITSRNAKEGKEAARQIGTDDNVLAIEADVCSFEDQQKAVQQTLNKFGQIDLLVANAGVGHFASIEELEIEKWQQVIDTNLTGVFYSIKSTLEALKKSKGMIVTISSLAGTNFFPKGAAYNASKFGLTGFTQAVMLDLRQHGIRVSTIMPGSVATYFNGHTPSEEDAWKIQPEDIGKMVQDLMQMEARTLPSKIEVRPSMPPKK